MFARMICQENQLTIAFEHEIVFIIKKHIQNYRHYYPTTSELIKPIDIEVRIENISLKDRFEWDINDPDNSPEEFAECLCKELALSEEFVKEVSFQIREQITEYQRQISESKGNLSQQLYDDFSLLKKSTRSLLESSSRYNPFLKNMAQIITPDNYLRPIQYVYKDNTDNLALWEPHVTVLEKDDLEKIKKLEDRKSRYVRRTVR
eukprot:TRINITY_DN5125_c0_g1_i1.p1 TRINITY_DN5125_c0_g1~~TRINITY_DN5125_c0_g1_i1.p1  ORF type:complete len:205 (+),score=28.65 TRINITY_DN5125_c0_g1_i1:258-872(+)